MSENSGGEAGKTSFFLHRKEEELQDLKTGTEKVKI